MGLVVVQVVKRVGEGVHQIGGKICRGSLSSFFSNRKSTKWVVVAAPGSTRERENRARKIRARAWCRSYVYGRDTCEKREIRMCWSVSVLEWFVISFHVVA
jgi:hypothetical protein